MLPPLDERDTGVPKRPSPSGLASYEEVLAAVFSQAGIAEPYRPESVVAFLSELPGHLSQESRYIAMEEELARQVKSDPAEIVGAAAAQLVELRQELQRHTQEHKEDMAATRGRIAILEAELAQLRTKLGQLEDRGSEHRQELLTRIDEMTGVIVFFDGYQAYLYRREQENARVAPTFLDDETALRLLENSRERDRAG